MTYPEVARQVGAKLCTGCAGNFNHTRGAASRGTGTVHWTDRRLNKPGLRRFLILAAQLAMNMGGINSAEDLYKVNKWAADRARTILHVSIPSRYSDLDRASVRWQAHRGASLSQAARRWAGR